MSNNPGVKLAFLGCGAMAKAHWRGIQDYAPQIKVTAIVDIDLGRASEMAAQTGGQVFSSLEIALEQGDFDAVDIMLPHNLHVQAAIQAFAAGKHVILEKPMATTLDGCERILAAAKAAGTVFMVAEQSQYWPDAIKIQQLIQGGALGEIITVRANYVDVVDAWWGPKPWRYDIAIAGGGICIDGGIHWIRPLRMWLGEIDEVVAVLGYPLKEMQGESLAHAIFRFQSGKLAVFQALRADTPDAPAEDFCITGTEGIIITEKGSWGRSALLYDNHHPQGHEIITTGKNRDDAYGLELADFSSAVLEGTPLKAGPEVSLGELRTVLAMYRSAHSQKWEKVWD
jgi:UDP-N-acetyl-2-amino-2-deoxyglucuronate dehydrogenase